LSAFSKVHFLPPSSTVLLSFNGSALWWSWAWAWWWLWSCPPSSPGWTEKSGLGNENELPMRQQNQRAATWDKKSKKNWTHKKANFQLIQKSEEFFSHINIAKSSLFKDWNNSKLENFHSLRQLLNEFWPLSNKNNLFFCKPNWPVQSNCHYLWSQLKITLTSFFFLNKIEIKIYSLNWN